MSTNEQMVGTRIYLIIFMAATIVLVIYSGLTLHSQQIIIRNPTTIQYEELYRLYRPTLSCPCQNVSVLRSTFTSFRVRYHQFCSSRFIEEDGFLRYWPMRFLNGTIDYNPPFYSHDFRRYGFKFLQFMKTTCEFLLPAAQQNIEAYLGEAIFTSEPITEIEFNQTVLTDFVNVAWKVRYEDIVAHLYFQRFIILFIHFFRFHY